MTNEPSAYIVVSVSNIAYFLLSLYMFVKNVPYAWLVFLVSIVSTVFHLHPESKAAYIVDIITSNLAILLISFALLPHVKDRTLMYTSIGIFILALVFFFESGTDRMSGKYEFLHSAWHVLTSISLYVLITSLKLNTNTFLSSAKSSVRS